MSAKTAKPTESVPWVGTASPALTTTSKRNSASRRTFQAFRKTSLAGSSGFTLLEIMIVMALIAMIFTVGGTAVSRVTYQRVRSTTRKFVGTVRRVRNDAILLNNIHRLAVDLDHNTWWVETQKKFELLTEPDPNDKKKKDPKDKDEEQPSNFGVSDRYQTKPTELPSGVKFEGLYKEKEGLQTQGMGYIHFFPNGFSEQAILYITKEGAEPKNGYSLIVRPTAGRVEIMDQYVQSFE